jgi:hypothetical protein
MNKIKKWYWNMYFQFEYRHVSDGLCCCGEDNCNGDSSHSPVSAKDYAIESAVNNKINNNKG